MINKAANKKILGVSFNYLYFTFQVTNFKIDWL